MAAKVWTTNEGTVGTSFDVRVENGETVQVFNADPATLIETVAFTSLVFQPGGVAGGNVYTTWTSLYAAASQIKGIIWVFMDDSVAAAHVTAGAYNINNWHIVGNLNAANETLIVDVGVTFTFNELWLENGLILENNAVNAYTPVAGSFNVIHLYEGASINSNVGASPFANVPSTVSEMLFNLKGPGSFIGTGTNPVVNVQAAAGAVTFFNLFNDSSIAANTTSGAGATTANVICDSTASIKDTNLTQTNLIGLNQRIGQNTAGALGPANNVTQPAPNSGPNLTRQRTGQCLVSWTVSGTDTVNSEAITLIIQQGITTIFTEVLESGAAGHFSGSGEVLATLPNFTATQFTLSLTGAAGNLTVPQNRAYIRVAEL